MDRMLGSTMLAVLIFDYIILIYHSTWNWLYSLFMYTILRYWDFAMLVLRCVVWTAWLQYKFHGHSHITSMPPHTPRLTGRTTASQGWIQDFHLGGGGHKYVRAVLEVPAFSRRSGPAQRPWKLTGFCMLFLELIYKHFDTKWDYKIS